jgi:hypothetical protein
VASLDAWMLSGVGICGLPLSPDIIKFALVSALIPALAVLLFRGEWWIPPSVYASPVIFAALFGILSGEWPRFYVALGCVAIAFASAWPLRQLRK